MCLDWSVRVYFLPYLLKSESVRIGKLGISNCEKFGGSFKDLESE